MKDGPIFITQDNIARGVRRAPNLGPEQESFRQSPHFDATIQEVVRYFDFIQYMHRQVLCNAQPAPDCRPASAVDMMIE